MRPHSAVIAERRILHKNLREGEFRGQGQHLIAADNPDLPDGLFAAVLVGSNPVSSWLFFAVVRRHDVHAHACG